MAADTNNVSFFGILRLPILVVLLCASAIVLPAAAAADTPVVGISSPAFNAKLNTAQVPVSFTVEDSDAIVSMKCSVDGGTSEDCTSPWTTPTLGEGIHYVIVEATDEFSNVGSSPVAFTIDLTPPETSLSGGGLPASRTTSTNATFSFTSSDPQATFQCRLDPEPFTTCTSPKSYSGLTDGFNAFEVRAVDPSGNADPTPASHTWEVDLDGPAIAITGHPPANKTFGTFVFSVDETAQSVQCRLNGGAFTTCLSPVEVSGLVDQQVNSFRVRATDELGNVSEALYSWTVDTVAPPVASITSPANGSWQNTGTPTFSGTVIESGSGVRVYNGTIALGTAVTTGTDWQFTPSTPLADGTYAIRTRSFDAAGNFSGFSPVVTVNIDTVAPAAPSLTFDSPTNDPTPTVGGSTEHHATVEVFVDGAPSGTSAAAGPSGDWSAALAPQADGTYNVHAVAFDRAGNASSPSATQQLQIDTLPPAVPTIVSPVTGSLFPDSTVEFLGSGEAGSEITVLRGSTPVATTTVEPGGSWMVTVNETEQGEHEYSAVAGDTAGNTSDPSDSVSVTVDTVPPTLTFSVAPAAFTNLQTAEFTIEADEPDVDLECSFDGGGWAPCAADVEIPGLVAGTYEFRARGTDFGGLTGPDAIHTWTVDTTPPDAPSIDTPAEAAALTDATPQFSGEAEPFATVTVFEDGAPVLEATADSDGDWAGSSADLPQGAVEVHAVAADRAGNASGNSATRSFTIDSIAPDSSIVSGPISLTNQASAQFEFTSDDPSATFECRLDGGAWEGCTSPEQISVAHGIRQFEVRATDTAGNVESSPASRSWQVDLVAPTGSSSEISGSRGSDGIPSFTIASNDPAATKQCSVDGGASAACATPFKPVGLAAGQHELVVTYTDVAGNSSQQSIDFDVTPEVTEPEPTPPVVEPAPPAPACPVAKGIEISRLSMKLSKRRQVVSFAAAVGVAEVSIRSGSSTLSSASAALKRGRNSIVLRAARARTDVFLQVRTVDALGIRTTSTIALARAGGSYKPAPGAKLAHSSSCENSSAAGVRVSARFGQASAGARTAVATFKASAPSIVKINDAALAIARGSTRVRLRFPAALAPGSQTVMATVTTIKGRSEVTLGTLRVR